MNITGRLISLHVLAGRSDLCVLAVSGNAFGGQFNCSPWAVSLDGVVAPSVEKIAQFVSTRNCLVTLREVDDTQGGIGVRPCAGADLVTEEP